jgi:hypothetical protein
MAERRERSIIASVVVGDERAHEVDENTRLLRPPVPNGSGRT